MGDYYRLNPDKTVTAIDDPKQWALAYENRDQRRVARTELEGGAWVSTVFLGLNHAYDEDSPPLIFETMAFGPDNMSEHFCERYSTYEEAQQGHEKAVALIRDHLASGKLLNDLPYSFDDAPAIAAAAQRGET